MKDHNRRDGEAVQDAQDLIAIGPAVDSELVLHDRHIELIKGCSRLHLRSGRPRGEVTHDVRSDDRFWPVDDSYDSGSVAIGKELGSK